MREEGKRLTRVPVISSLRVPRRGASKPYLKRSIVQQHVSNLKTEASKKLTPLDEDLIAELLGITVAELVRMPCS